MQNGTVAGESNGDVSFLRRGDEKLEFRLDEGRRKIVRTSTREQGEREYDLTLKEEDVESEVEEFVRALYS
jgi:hypothetical protein